MAVIIEKELVQLNDGMKFVKLKPHPQLGEYIDFFWTLEYTLDRPLDLTILPENSSEIIFNLGSAPIYFQKNGAFQKAPIMEIIGPLGRAMAVQAGQPFQLLGVRFFPHTASIFFIEHMDVFSDRISELSTTRKYQWNSVWNQLLELQTLSKRIECLNLLFLSILSIKKEHQPKFHELFNWLYGLQDPVDVATIVRKSGYSYRHTEMVFKNCVGLSPQQYLQTKRMQRAIALMNQQDLSLTTIAYQCGYADQSHFIRSFKSLVGQTPLRYRKTGNKFNFLMQLSNPLAITVVAREF